MRALDNADRCETAAGRRDSGVGADQLETSGKLPHPDTDSDYAFLLRRTSRAQSI